MAYIPTKEDLAQYSEPKSSIAHSYKDYLQGLGSGILQSGAEAGRSLAMTPSYLYEAATGKPGYNLVKPDVLGFSPNSDAGDTGKEIGNTVGNIGSSFYPGKWTTQALRAFSRYHPLTKGQMGRQFQNPINTAERAAIRGNIDNNHLYEMNDLFSHAALEPRGAASRGITPMGRQALVQEVAEGRVPGMHSAQSLLGDLERVLPELGESSLVRTRIRPLKEYILNEIIRSMQEGGIPESAEEYNTARQGARRHYQTRRLIKKAVKPLSLGALIKMAVSGGKSLP